MQSIPRNDGSGNDNSVGERWSHILVVDTHRIYYVHVLCERWARWGPEREGPVKNATLCYLLLLSPIFLAFENNQMWLNERNSSTSKDKA